MPGLGRLLEAEIQASPEATVTGHGFDGRSDVVTFALPGAEVGQALGLRLAEDVFVEVGRTLRSHGDAPGWIAGRILRRNRLDRAVALRSRLRGPVAGGVRFRVAVRVLQERAFLRTALRQALVAGVRGLQPSWEVADPAPVEIWVLEHRPGALVAGLRLTGREMRQHGGRPVERQGALRPAVAAAMVRASDLPPGRLLDPCCGSGTILSEAAEVGWQAAGIDMDPVALRGARRNLAADTVVHGDARVLPVRSGSVDACVSNLPFGRQYTVPGDPALWMGRLLVELARVTRPGGRVVLLVPELPPAAVPAGLAARRPTALRLLGQPTRLWVLDRTPAGRA